MAGLLTVGHGRLTTDELVAVLTGAQVDVLVDVRRYPGSRTSPHLSTDALAEALPAAGVAYRWDPRLGGRRRLPEDAAAPDTWWTVEAFRAYAAWTRTAEFTEALAELLEQAATRTVAVMCSETVWWRCHRRLIADVAALGHGVGVLHLLPPAPPRPHQVAAGARLSPDGSVVWDRPAS